MASHHLSEFATEIIAMTKIHEWTVLCCSNSVVSHNRRTSRFCSEHVDGHTTTVVD